MNTEKKNISVSVIIPVYNAGKFLVETIESVLHQSFDSFELILVNDGSTDNSSVICEEYLKKDTRIQYFDQANSGVSVARNLGLSHACGEYVFFLDSDDTIDHEFLKTSYDAAKEKDDDIIIIGEEFCKRLPNVPALPTCAQFLRLDFLKKHADIKFPQNIQPCEDGLFSHQLIALTKNIGINPKGIYHYRHHENQNHLKINENSDKVLQQIPVWLQILEDFYERYDLYKVKALHLALFIEHEPFEFRYLGMLLNTQQKTFLHALIKNYMLKILPYLSAEEKGLLSKPFLYFINTDDASDFDKFYIEYSRQQLAKKKLYLFFIKLIPLKKLRRDLRKSISERF